MNTLVETVLGFFKYVVTQVTLMGFVDIADIAILSILLYFVYKFIRERRASKLAAGVVFLVILLAASEFFGMHAMKFILSNFFQVGIIALLVVFQPELRSALEKMGARPLQGLMSIGEQRGMAELSSEIEAICNAVFDMAKDKTGALIVIERSTKLGDFIKSGEVINADVNKSLIKNIFYNKAPLHDGAMIMRDFRVYAASCFLPLSNNSDIIHELGTRHRAAIGISEISDSYVIIVSEETGVVSVAIDGKLKRDYTYSSLQNEMISIFTTQNANKKVSIRKNNTKS